MKIIFIAWKNCWQKAGATTLTLLLLSFGVGIISMMLLLENQLSEKFNKNIKDIDFVLGAKGSPLQLILANVYHIDAPTGNIKVSEAQRIIKNPTVKEAIPLAYGDNYEGWRIVGTTPRYSEFYGVKLKEGKVFETPFEVTVGSYAAKELGLKLGQTFKSNHGLDKDGEEEEGHDQLFTVVGIYEASGTVIDRLILTPVESIWEVHDHGDHEESPHNAIVSAEEHDAEEHAHSDDEHDHDAEHEHDHEEDHDAEHTAEEAHDHEDDHMHEEEREVTAYLLIKRLPMAPMILPQLVKNTNMQLALPAIEINRLNENFGIGMSVVKAVAILIMIISFLSVFISLFNALRERQYELAILRTLGGRRIQLFILILLEGFFMVALGLIIGLALSRVGITMLSDMAKDSFHDEFNAMIFLPQEYYLVGITLGLGVVASLLPALRAFFMDISKTLSND
ncbi:MAG: ABC transporter permease [Flavobacteriales bacterium]|nr:ABC transporter permease [Flavobacteriales bacterium]